MSKRKAIEYLKKHCCCDGCAKYFTKENKKPCIKDHPFSVKVRWDIVMKAINLALEK